MDNEIKILIIEVNEINRLMNYDRSKTLNENLLINEQWSDWNYQTGNPFSQGQTQSWNRYVDEKTDDFVDFFEETKWHHIILPIAAIVISVGTAGIGGIIFAGILEAADAYLYYQEGDTTTAALATIFLLIPGGVLITRIPGVKNLIKEAGERGIGKLLTNIKRGLPLNSAERAAVNGISKQQDELYKLAIRYSNIVEKTSALMEMGLRGTVILLLHLARLPIFTLKWTIRIGGVLFAGNELLYRLTQYYDIKWEEHWGPKPTLTEEQLAVSDDVLVKAEEELNERATGQIKTINESEEPVIIEVEKVLTSFDVNQYVIN